MNTKTTPGPVFVTNFRERSVAMLREKCFTYEVGYIYYSGSRY